MSTNSDIKQPNQEVQPKCTDRRINLLKDLSPVNRYIYNMVRDHNFISAEEIYFRDLNKTVGVGAQALTYNYVQEVLAYLYNNRLIRQTAKGVPKRYGAVELEKAADVKEKQIDKPAPIEINAKLIDV